MNKNPKQEPVDEYGIPLSTYKSDDNQEPQNSGGKVQGISNDVDEYGIPLSTYKSDDKPKELKKENANVINTESESTLADTEYSSESQSVPYDPNFNYEDAEPLPISEQIDNQLHTPSSSFRKIQQGKLDNVNSQLNYIENKASVTSKDTGMVYQDILDGDGNYEMLLKEKVKYEQDIANENKILEELSKDTNGEVGVINATLKWLAAPLADTQGTEQLDLSEEVEEEILRNLPTDRRTREKISRGHLPLREKESIITNARYNVLVREKDKIAKEYNSIIDTLNNTKAEDIEERINLQKRLNKLQNRNDYINVSTAYNQAEGTLQDTFKKTTESRKRDEALSDNKTLDVVSSLGEGLIQTAADKTVGSVAWALSSVGDIFTDKDGYSSFDAFEDAVHEWSNNNILPSSKKEIGKIVDDKGEWNVTPYSIGKTASQAIPFTAHLINDARKGKVNKIHKKLAKLINPKKHKKLAQSLKLAESAFKMTVLDNKKEAESLGLDGLKASTYAATKSGITGLVQMVMPDTNFVNSSSINGLLKSFSGQLNKAVTKKAIYNVSKDFIVNVAKEIGEEEIELAASDLLKTTMLVNNPDSEFFDMKVQKELLANTLVVSGLFGGSSVRSKFKESKRKMYDDVANNLHDLTDNIDSTINELTNEQDIAKLHQVKKFATDVTEMVNKSPSNVTGEQIDLLIEKKGIIEEMNQMDDSFHPEYRKKIEDINNKIQSLNNVTESESNINDTELSETKETLLNQEEVLESESNKEDIVNDIKENGVEEENNLNSEQENELNSINDVDLASDLGINKVYEILDKYDKDLSKFGDETLGMNLPVVVAKGAIKAMKLAVKTAKVGADITSAGINYIKNTDWYNSLNEEEKIELTNDNIGNIISKTYRPSNTASQVIREQKNKVKDRLANLKKGFKEGVKETKQMKTDFIESVKDLLTDKNLFTQNEVKTILNQVKNVSSTNINSVSKTIDGVLARAVTRKEKSKLNTLNKKIRKYGKSNSKSHPVNLKKLAKLAGSIDFNKLDESDKQRYGEILNEINKSFSSITNPEYKMVNVNKLTSELNYLNDKVNLNNQSQSNQTNVSQNTKSQNNEKKVTDRAVINKNKLIRSTINTTNKNRKLLNLLSNVDISSLNQDLQKLYVKVTDNIMTNGDFSNAGKLQGKIEADNNVKSLVNYIKKNKINLRQVTSKGNIFKNILNAMISLNVFLDHFGGSSKIGGELYHYLGLHDLSNSNVSALKKKDNFVKFQEDLMKKVKKNYPNVGDGNQVIRRAILATLLQSDKNSSESMSRFKDDYIKQSIKTLEKFTTDSKNKKIKEILENTLTELENVNTKEDLIQYLKDNDRGNFLILKGVSDKFLEISDDFERNTNVIHGEGFTKYTKDDFYLPLASSNLLSNSFKAGGLADSKHDKYNPQRMNSAKSGSRIDRKKQARLQLRQTINFNFDNYVQRQFGEQVYDIESAQTIQKIKNILNHEDVIDMLGSSLVELEKRVINKINIDSGVVMNSTSSLERKIGRIEKTIRTIGSVDALGGIDQYAKQYPAVIASALVRLGVKNSKYLGQYMFTNKANIPLLKMSSIVLRGDTQGGTTRVADNINFDTLTVKEKSTVRKIVDTLTKNTQLTSTKAKELAMLSLRKGDVNAANTTFLSYYHSYLADKGVKDVDMMTEHLKIEDGDQLRKKAFAYAQHMVNTTQTSSDLSEGSSLLANPNLSARLLASIIIPFSSHANNAVVRFIRVTGNLGKGLEVKTNLNEMAASLTEIISFHSMKAFVLTAGTTYLAQLMYGLEEEEDEDGLSKELIDWGFQTKKAYSGIIGDIVPLPDKLEMETLNFMLYLQRRKEYQEEGETLSYREYDKLMRELRREDSSFKEPFKFYSYRDMDGIDIGFQGMGIYDIPLSRIDNIYKAWDALDNKVTENNKFGGSKTFNIDHAYNKFLMGHALKQTATLFFAWDATDRRMSEKRFRQIIKQSKKED